MRSEIQFEIEKNITKVASIEPPHPATGKCQRCRNCKNVRLPHKSNPHYACGVQHQNVEPIWTCSLYLDKKLQ